jgi:hypothetical protein
MPGVSGRHQQGWQGRTPTEAAPESARGAKVSRPPTEKRHSPRWPRVHHYPRPEAESGGGAPGRCRLGRWHSVPGRPVAPAARIFSGPCRRARAAGPAKVAPAPVQARAPRLPGSARESARPDPAAAGGPACPTMRGAPPDPGVRRAVRPCLPARPCCLIPGARRPCRPCRPCRPAGPGSARGLGSDPARLGPGSVPASGRRLIPAPPQGSAGRPANQSTRI